MEKGTLHRFMGRLAAIDIVIGTLAFFMQAFNDRLYWVFVITVVVLVWLSLAWFFSILETITD